MITKIKPNAAQSAKLFGCSIEQAKRLFAENAKNFLVMSKNAEASGKPLYRGFTAQQLRDMAADYLSASR